MRGLPYLGPGGLLEACGLDESDPVAIQVRAELPVTKDQREGFLLKLCIVLLTPVRVREAKVIGHSETPGKSLLQSCI